MCECKKMTNIKYASRSKLKYRIEGKKYDVLGFRVCGHKMQKMVGIGNIYVFVK